MNSRFPTILGLIILSLESAHAETPADFLNAYQAEARRAEPGFSASAPRGGQFFRRVGSREWSCATCHSDDPAAIGKHASTGKVIEPLAPATNDKRFTRADKVEKWFKRNCNDVVGRPCSAAEKSDVLAYLVALKK